MYVGSKLILKKCIMKKNYLSQLWRNQKILPEFSAYVLIIQGWNNEKKELAATITTAYNFFLWPHLLIMQQICKPY